MVEIQNATGATHFLLEYISIKITIMPQNLDGTGPGQLVTYLHTNPGPDETLISLPIVVGIVPVS